MLAKDGGKGLARMAGMLGGAGGLDGLKGMGAGPKPLDTEAAPQGGLPGLGGPRPAQRLPGLGGLPPGVNPFKR
jgi:signal recognition particle subunit SRP54